MIRKKIIAAVLLLLLCSATQCKISCKPKSCHDLYCYKRSFGIDGPFVIFTDKPRMPETITVVCDNVNQGGGWIGMLRRDLLFNVTNFNVSLEQFKLGIGELFGDRSEFYLGHELIHQITTNFPGGKAEIRYEAMSYGGDSMGVRGKDFYLENEASGYKWHSGSEYDRSNVPVDFLSGSSNLPFGYGNPYCQIQFNKQPFWFQDHERCTRMFPFGTIVFELDTVKHKQHFWAAIAGGSPTILRFMRMAIRPYGATLAKTPCHNPCLHGGTCMYEVATDTHFCICHEDYCGLTCEKARSDCKHGGICVHMGEIDPPFCICAHSHCGPTCETPNPCNNSVLCTYKNDEASCICPPGIFGTYCEVVTNCKNGGTPTYNPADGTTQCICPSTHCGDVCEEIDCGFLTDPCLETPCQNDGTCNFNKDANKFSCECTKYYKGPTCRNKRPTVKAPAVLSHHKDSVGYYLFLPLLLLLAILVIGCIGFMVKKHREDEQEKQQEDPQNDQAKTEVEEAGLFGFLGF